MTSSKNNGSPELELLRRYLSTHDWPAREMEGRDAFQAQKDTELCPVIYYFQLKVDHQEFLFFIVPQITLLPDMLPPAMEFITRANYGMRIGNFELDLRDGQLGFKSSLSYKGDRLSEALIDAAVAAGLRAYDEYYPGLARVIAGLDSPAQAIHTIEYGDGTP